MELGAWSLELGACTHLTLHGVRVDLAHVGAPVLHLHALDVQVPRAVVVVGHGYSWIVGNDMVVYSLDRLGVGLYPSNLQY